MPDIYCHIHTPVNILEEENKFFIPPIIVDGNLYIVKEKKLHDVLLYLGYFQEYIKFTRENGYKNVSKWLNKKNLLNCSFLEAVSQYFIENIHLKQVYDYKYFHKNNLNKPVISDEYLKNIFMKVVLYKYIKENQDKFNEEVEKNLNIIENELSFINNEKNRNLKQLHYQNKIFDIFLENFITKHETNDILQELNNINFSCETLLSSDDLFIYKTASINCYKDFNFKLSKTSHTECLRENTFVKLYAGSTTSCVKEDQIKYILEQLKTYSQLFTLDTIDFGVAHLQKIICCEDSVTKKKAEPLKYQNKEIETSSVAMLQRTQTIISEAEEHIISRYNSLKSHTNIYFAPEKEIITLINVLNMDKENLKRLNSLIREKSNKVETELIKFTFKKGNLPYSAYGFASLNY